MRKYKREKRDRIEGKEKYEMRMRGETKNLWQIKIRNKDNATKRRERRDHERRERIEENDRK